MTESDPDRLPTLELLEVALRAGEVDPLGEGEDDPGLSYLCALQKRPERLVFDTAVRWCRSARPAAQAFGARVLSELGIGLARPLPFRSESLPVLQDMLESEQALAVAGAVLALGRLGLDESAPRVAALLTHPEAIVRLEVARAFGSESTELGIGTLIALSGDPDERVRDWATFGLGSLVEVDTPAIRDALWARAHDAHDETRYEARLGLARRRDPQVIPLVEADLRGEEVWRLSVDAAWELAVPELLPALRELEPCWSEEGEWIREAIARCEGRSVDPDA